MLKQIVTFFFILATTFSFGQGVTTSSFHGKITDTNGDGLIGANILALHVPTGATYGTVTDADGYYRLPNIKVGGPYKVDVSYIGFDDQSFEDVFFRLGENQKIDITLQEGGVMIDELVITGTSLTTGQSTGTSTQISTEDIEKMPTLDRNLNDFLKLTPQANGSSFAGINNRYNAIYIDGAVNNDVFGLAGSGTNGGQTGISPFSIDIIDQFQVVLSPYDVSLGGFAGGGINAVTKSGTNEFKGTAYYFFKNENLVGKTNKTFAESIGLGDDDRTKLAPFSEKTFGASLGGPIIKDKVFFFTNVEIQDEVTPSPFNIAQYTSDAEGRSTEAELENLRQFVQNTYGYDPGTFGDVNDELKGLKIFGKIDVNLSSNNKLTLRHNYTKAEQSNRNSGNSRTLNFSNNGVFFPSTTNSSALELNTRIGTGMSNNLIIGYTSVKDDRGSLGQDFPYVTIEEPGSGQIRLGTEQFSTANFLSQKIFSITDNLKLYKGKHTLTIGTHNEFYDIRNVFIRQNFGSYRFASVDDFINGVGATEYDRSYSLVDEITGDQSAAAADFGAMQLGFYAQDEIEMTSKFKLTAGLRIDIPIITSDPEEDVYFNSTALPAIRANYDIDENVRAGKAPDGQLMFSPRVGFEYLPQDDRSTVIRGGVGIFTSRIPFVWPGAMFNNNGLTIGGVNERDITEDILFRPDIQNQYTNPNFSVPSGQMDLFASDFKYPQVLRGNLAMDKTLAGGWNVTLEGMYTKTLNNIFYQNVNSSPTVDFTWANAPDRRNVYTRNSIDRTYSAVYLASNTSEGYTYNLTAIVDKRFASGLDFSFAYTYGNAFAVNEGTSSQNSSQWRGQIHIDDRNAQILGRSDYALGSRIVSTLSYRLPWGQNSPNATTFSLYYNGQSGDAFSYVIAGSSARNLANQAGSTSRNRSLIYVPQTSGDINLIDYISGGNTVTAAEQWSNLDAFISADPSLDGARGGYAEKNGATAPFTSFLDLAIRQDIGTRVGGRDHKLQLSLDIFNFANLINSSWGSGYNVPGDFNNYFLYQFEGYATDGITPQFTYRDTDNGKDSFNRSDSRWRMRLGVRYIFD